MQNEIKGYALHLEKCAVVNTMVINASIVGNKQYIRLYLKDEVPAYIQNDDGEYTKSKTRSILMYTNAVIARLAECNATTDVAIPLNSSIDKLPLLLSGAVVAIASYEIPANATSYINEYGNNSEWNRDYATIVHSIADIELADTILVNSLLQYLVISSIDVELARTMLAEVIKAQMAEKAKAKAKATIKASVTTSATDSTATDSTATSDIATAKSDN